MLKLRFGALLVFAVLLAACGADDGGGRRLPTSVPSALPSASAPVTAADPTPEPAEIRVAFLNLMSPVALDATQNIAGDTYEQRLTLIIEELKAFRPDIVGFNEMTITAKHGSAAERLSKELKLEPIMVRANPWVPGKSKEQNDALADQFGFREGELILTRFPVLGNAAPHWLDLRTSELEGRAALHVRLKGPKATGDIDVYITHLTGGGERVRTAQAASLLPWIEKTRGKGPMILMGDLSDTPETTTYKTFTGIGLRDVAADANLPTCCRDSVIGEQAAPTTRTDFLFAQGMPLATVSQFGAKPKQLADGTLLWASDHNGIFATFPINQAAPQ